MEHSLVLLYAFVATAGTWFCLVSFVLVFFGVVAIERQMTEDRRFKRIADRKPEQDQ